MSKKVKVSLILRQFTDGQEFVDVEGDNPVECLRDFARRYPEAKQWLIDEKGEIRPQVWLFLNGEEIRNDKLTSPLDKDDELFILLAIGGG